MAELKSSSFVMNGNNLISGRCKLYGVQIGAPNRNLSTAHVTDPSKSSVTLTNGSSSGATLFKFSYPPAYSFSYGNGIQPLSFMFDNHWILFDSGIYVNQMLGTSAFRSELDRDFVRLTLFYEV